jgi:hypothetical protein
VMIDDAGVDARLFFSSPPASVWPAGSAMIMATNLTLAQDWPIVTGE